MKTLQGQDELNEITKQAEIPYNSHENMAACITQIFQERLIFVFPLLPILLSLFFIYRWISLNFTTTKKLPPSPPKLPIIGNLHQLGSSPARSLQTLSAKYGDLMLLHLGSKPTIVVSSAEVASQVLKTHDRIFAGRPKLSIFRKLLGNGMMISSSPYGEYWREMRSICMFQLLSSKRVRSYRRVREEEVAIMIKNIQGLTRVNLSDMFMSLSNDLTCRVAFGKKYREEKGDIDFTKTLDAFIKLLGTFYIGSFVSWLAWIHKIDGVDAKVNIVVHTLDRFLEGIIQDHSDRATKRNGDGEGNEQNVKDFVDVLLEVQRDDASEYPLLNRESLKCLIQDIFGAGTQTTAVILQWAMSELLRNPRVLHELQKEVTRITRSKETVTEDDLENMNYLKAVLKETLRLHPPGPFLIPHECTEDVKIKGYDISAGTQVYVNVWAIGRNPKYWEEPESFYPERFLNSPTDFKGHDFQFIPFGSGRRICPGITLAIANMELVVHHFDWSLPDGAASESLDMTESPGMAMHRNTPLIAVASPRIG